MYGILACCTPFKYRRAWSTSRGAHPHANREVQSTPVHTNAVQGPKGPCAAEQMSVERSVPAARPSRARVPMLRPLLTLCSPSPSPSLSPARAPSLRKKRKWDLDEHGQLVEDRPAPPPPQPPPPQPQPPQPQPVIRLAPPPPTQQQQQQQAAPREDDLSEMIEINDLRARMNLTRGPIQDQVRARARESARGGSKRGAQERAQGRAQARAQVRTQERAQQGAREGAREGASERSHEGASEGARERRWRVGTRGSVAWHARLLEGAPRLRPYLTAVPRPFPTAGPPRACGRVRARRARCW